MSCHRRFSRTKCIQQQYVRSRVNIPVSSRTENGTSTVARLADPSEWRKPIVEIMDWALFVRGLHTSYLVTLTPIPKGSDFSPCGNRSRVTKRISQGWMTDNCWSWSSSSGLSSKPIVFTKLHYGSTHNWKCRKGPKLCTWKSSEKVTSNKSDCWLLIPKGLELIYVDNVILFL